MQLRLEKNEPAARAALTELERRSDTHSQATRQMGMRPGRPRLHDELAVDDLGELRVGDGEKILVGGAFAAGGHGRRVARIRAGEGWGDREAFERREARFRTAAGSWLLQWGTLPGRGFSWSAPIPESTRHVSSLGAVHAGMESGASKSCLHLSANRCDDSKVLPAAIRE